MCECLWASRWLVAQQGPRSTQIPVNLAGAGDWGSSWLRDALTSGGWWCFGTVWAVQGPGTDEVHIPLFWHPEANVKPASRNWSLQIGQTMRPLVTLWLMMQNNSRKADEKVSQRVLQFTQIHREKDTIERSPHQRWKVPTARTTWWKANTSYSFLC